MNLLVVAGIVVGAVLLLIILTMSGTKRDAFSAGEGEKKPAPPVAPGFISKEKHDKKMREMFKRLRGRDRA